MFNGDMQNKHGDIANSPVVRNENVCATKWSAR